jgi:hypothetical protein
MRANARKAAENASSAKSKTALDSIAKIEDLTRLGELGQCRGLCVALSVLTLLSKGMFADAICVD